MATRPPRPRPAQPKPAQPAKAQPAQTQARKAKPQPAQPQPAQGRSAKAQPLAKRSQPAADSPSALPAAAPPPALRVAAAVQAAEAVGLLVAAGFAAVATADGKSYEKSSGIALTLIAVGTAALFAAFAVGLARARPWTRTPVVMFQLAIGIWGIFLLTGHRYYEVAVPMLLLAAATLACVLTPASVRALNRPPRQP
jgi:hypothetical protein